MVPSYSRKAISGWTNYSCKVISHKIDENQMDNRGSKSEFHNSVKEQRVDGSWCIEKYNSLHLRCTLMGFERNYQIKIPSNQLNKLSFSTLNYKPNLNPWFVTGFTDAEGCFSISIKPDAKLKLKWRASPLFIIKLHIKDLAILEEIKHTLGVGKIRKNGINSVQYLVETFKEFQVIVEHFNKYPLVTAKVSDFLLFKQCFEIIKQGEHLTENGILKLVGLKSSLNWGLSEKLKFAFPNVVLVNRPVYNFKAALPLDPFWVAGFTSGDGSFNLTIKSPEAKKGYRVSLRFSINLNVRELAVIKGLVTFFNLHETKVSKIADVTAIETNVIDQHIYISEKSVTLQITKISDIVDTIIPFFEKYPILGVKSLDFADFQKVAKIVVAKEHLTPEGFKLILEIKSNMNQSRRSAR